MKSKLTVKGKGIANLARLSNQMKNSAPYLKIGALQDSGASVKHATKKNRAPERRTKTTTAESRTTSRGPSSSLTNAELLAVHEFGAPRANIPARAPLRTTAERYRDQWQTYLQRGLQRALSAANPMAEIIRTFELVGLRAVADVHKTIRAHLPPPLKAATIARKGSSTPLIDTSRLLQSIGFEVVRKPR